MVLKWTNSNGNTELLFFDSVSKFVLMGKSICAYDAFVTSKAISTGVFRSETDALKIFDEIIRRLNLFGNTDEDSETDFVFDTIDFLENNSSSW